MGLDTKANIAVEAEEVGDSQSKKAAKKLAKEAAKAAKVISDKINDSVIIRISFIKMM